MGARVPHDEIRRMVRELLRDAVAGSGAGSAPAEEVAATPAMSTRPAEVGGLSERVRAALASGGGGIEIAVASDSDLNAFAQQVALCALERDLLGAIASNRVRFRLAGGGGPRAAPAEKAAAEKAAPGAASPAKDGDAYHWEQGLLSETKITEIARSHAKLVLGRQALLTPLAWDRARSLGLQVVRMRP
ncbi:MAG TPA: hypothetical protein VGA50_06900 [Kiloniellales bacterium]